MNSRLEFLQKAEETTAALREATREAHEAIKDLRRAIKESQEARDRIEPDIQKFMEKEVERQLAELGKQTAIAMKEATEKVFKEFDKLSGVLLGVDGEKAPLEDLIRAYHEVERKKSQ